MKKTKLHIAIPAIMLCSFAYSSPRMAEFLGSSRSPANTFSAAATQPAPASAPESPPRGEVLFNSAIQKAVNTIARPLDPNATTIQKQAYEDARATDVAALVAVLPDNVVRLSFRIVDICPRPEPKAPNAPSNRATPEQLAAYQKALAKYEAEMAIIREQPLVAIGELDLTNKGQGDVKLTDDARQRLAAVNNELVDLRRRLQSAKENNERNSLKSQIAGAERRRQSIVASQKQSPGSNNGSDDFVYIFGTEEKFGKWRKQQMRSVIGWIERAQMLAEGTSRETADIKLDAVLRVLEDDGAPVQATTKPTE